MKNYLQLFIIITVLCVLAGEEGSMLHVRSSEAQWVHFSFLGVSLTQCWFCINWFSAWALHLMTMTNTHTQSSITLGQQWRQERGSNKVSSYYCGNSCVALFCNNFTNWNDHTWLLRTELQKHGSKLQKTWVTHCWVCLLCGVCRPASFVTLLYCYYTTVIYARYVWTV